MRWFPLMGKNREEVFQNVAKQELALKRFGRVEEVSSLVAFLASSWASLFHHWVVCTMWMVVFESPFELTT